MELFLCLMHFTPSNITMDLPAFTLFSDEYAHIMPPRKRSASVDTDDILAADAKADQDRKISAKTLKEYNSLRLAFEEWLKPNFPSCWDAELNRLRLPLAPEEIDTVTTRRATEVMPYERFMATFKQGGKAGTEPMKKFRSMLSRAHRQQGVRKSLEMYLEMHGLLEWV